MGHGMKIAEHLRGARPQCQAIVEPGEYTIDRWDNKRCEVDGLRSLAKCDACGAVFCLMMHWRKHLDSVPIDHFEKATS